MNGAIDWTKSGDTCTGMQWIIKSVSCRTCWMSLEANTFSGMGMSFS